MQKPHGGDYFYILTIDIGFGVNPVANLDALNLDAVYKESIVLDDQLIGDIQWWEISKATGTTFQYQNSNSFLSSFVFFVAKFFSPITLD